MSEQSGGNTVVNQPEKVEINQGQQQPEPDKTNPQGGEQGKGEGQNEGSGNAPHGEANKA